MTSRERVRKQDAVLHIRVYAEEKKAAYELARKSRLSMSELFRMLLAEEQKRAEAPRKNKVD